MGKWRDLFESKLPAIGKRRHGEQYTFASPATPEQIADAEQKLGVQLPVEIREILSEFDGIWCSTWAMRDQGCKPEISFLDLDHITISIPDYLGDGCESCPIDQLQQVVFFWQENGFGCLWGVCTKDVAGHRAGSVVRLDHEVQELEKAYRNVADFFRRGPHT